MRKSEIDMHNKLPKKKKREGEREREKLFTLFFP